MIQNILDLHAGHKRVGHEYHGPCPSCGGKDRFIIWPDQGYQPKLGIDIGRFLCRQCGRTGDGIEYFRIFEGMSFAEAAAQFGIQTDEYVGSWDDREDIVDGDENPPVFSGKRDSDYLWSAWIFSPAEAILDGLVAAYEASDQDLHDTLLEILRMRMGALLAVARRYYQRHGQQMDTFIRHEFEQEAPDFFANIGMRLPDKTCYREETGQWVRQTRRTKNGRESRWLLKPGKKKIKRWRTESQQRYDEGYGDK